MNHGDLTADGRDQKLGSSPKNFECGYFCSDRRFSGKNMFADDGSRSASFCFYAGCIAIGTGGCTSGLDDLHCGSWDECSLGFFNFLLDVCQRLPLHNVSRVAQARGFDCGVFMNV